MSHKLVVITGCSSGIGKATARSLAAAGYRVIACVRKVEDGERLLEAAPTSLDYMLCDINEVSQRLALVERLAPLFSAETRPDFFAVINNAGVSPMAPIEMTSAEDFEHIFKTNVFSVVALIQDLLPYLKQSDSRIVNISSGAGVLATPLSGAYSMSKFSIEALSDILRVEFKAFGIKTIVVEPGLINTDIHDKNIASMEQVITRMNAEQRQAYETKMRHYVETMKLKSTRATPPLEVAEVIRRALESKKPRARYGAGRDARLLRRIHWLLSDRMRDAIGSRLLGA